MSEDKVRTKDSCWSIGMIYDPKELPEIPLIQEWTGCYTSDKEEWQAGEEEKSAKNEEQR
jgi:hypothetical protein